MRSLADEVVASLSRLSPKYAAAAEAVDSDVRDGWHARAWRKMHEKRAAEGVEGAWRAADRGARLTNQLLEEEEGEREADMRALLAEPRVDHPPPPTNHRGPLTVVAADAGVLGGAGGTLRLGRGGGAGADALVEKAARRVPDDYADSQLKPLRFDAPPQPMRDAPPDVRAAAAAAAREARGQAAVRTVRAHYND